MSNLIFILRVLILFVIIEAILAITFIVLYANAVTNNENTKENTAKEEKSIKEEKIVKMELNPQVYEKSGFGMFDHILYINLDKRPDRRWQVETELQKMGVPENRITRIPGVLETVGALGCSKAHLNALQVFEENKSWTNVLILEDDAMFSQRREQIDVLLNQFCLLNIHWDILMPLANVQEFKETQFHFLLQIIEAQTTAGYAINRHYLSTFKENVQEGIKLLSQYKDGHGDYCIDQYWKPLQKTGSWFMFHPTIGHQRDGFSNIENKNTSYPDKRLLEPKTKTIKYLVAVDSVNKHDYLDNLNLDWFTYSGDINLNREFEFNLLNHSLILKSKDGCDKFGKLLRFLRNYLNINKDVLGIFFTNDKVKIKTQNFTSFLDTNNNTSYWGKQEIVKTNIIAMNNKNFEVPKDLQYCQGEGFYLARECIQKLLFRQDLFLRFPNEDQLEFQTYHTQNEIVYKDVCVFENINIAIGLKSFEIYPSHKDLNEILEWYDMPSSLDIQQPFEFISLGIRCSSALSLDVAKLRMSAYPFDWAQFSINDMCDILDLPNDSNVLYSYYQNLTNDLDETKQNKLTKSWFPHDIFPDDISKYVRRTLRLNNLIRNSDSQLIFLTMFGVFENNHKEQFLRLHDKIKQHLKTKQFLFICVGASKTDEYSNDIYYMKDTVNTLNNDKNDWDIYEAIVAQNIRNLLKIPIDFEIKKKIN